MPTYLERLTLALAHGAAALSPAARQRHVDFLIAHQREDGGFAGRDGPSDLYYTSFALRGLSVLGALEGTVAERAAAFLKTRLSGREPLIDLVSLIFSNTLLELSAGIQVLDGSAHWKDQLSDMLERYRLADGGYGKTEQGAASSTYHSFLVALCLEVIERPVPDPAALVRFVLSQQGPDGGFREVRVAKRSGTNPTAAAVALLYSFDRLSSTIREDVAEFLLERQDSEGGLCANTRIPICDLLSSFTGLWTLVEIDHHTDLDLAALSRFVRSVEQEQGGFLAASWDGVCDVEYSFYGIATMSLLANRT